MDLAGPLIASATLSLLPAPIILATAFCLSAKLFILIRFLVGFCLANFIANQLWMSSMFSGNVVGLASVVSAGWADMGSRVAQLVKPLLYSMIKSFNVSASPRMVACVCGSCCLSSCDRASGNYKDLKKSSEKPKETYLDVLFHGLRNYRSWIRRLIYGYCFGVELIIDNMIAEYFYDRFRVNFTVAGTIAACFGTSEG